MGKSIFIFVLVVVGQFCVTTGTRKLLARFVMGTNIYSSFCSHNRVST